MPSMMVRKEDEPPVPPRHGGSHDIIHNKHSNSNMQQKKNASNGGSMRGNFYNQHNHSHSMPRLPLASLESPNKRAIPMWDSSDPARAPPPLPLNPNLNADGTIQLANSRTSATIAAAHQAMHDKAQRDIVPVSVSPYTTNMMNPTASVISTATTGSYASTAVASERFSPIKGLAGRDSSPSPAHRRMQSMQPSVRDMKAAFDGRSPDRTARAETPSSARNEHAYRTGSPSTPGRNLLRGNAGSGPGARRTSSNSPSRSPTKGRHEGTPPSAAMLALQTLSRDDDWSGRGLGITSTTPGTTGSGLTPIPSHATPVPMKSLTSMASAPSLISNSSAASTLGKSEAPVFGGLSTQIESLTSIATRLQHELTQLSRRSRDNATDLISLKEATNARDEDIRRSLRDLITTVNIQKEAPIRPSTAGAVRTPTKFPSMASIGSPLGHNDDAARGLSSPSSSHSHAISAANLESPASLAMLEKIIREMVTKEGQDRLLETLSHLLELSTKESGETRVRIDHLAEMVRRRQSLRHLPAGDKDSEIFDDEATVGSPYIDSADLSQGRAEIVTLLNTIRDSVASSGGVVSDLKAQQRDLRGEVLLMGRDLMTKVEEGIASAIGLGSELASDKHKSFDDSVVGSVDGDRALHFDVDSITEPKDVDGKQAETSKKKNDIQSIVSNVIRENLEEFKTSITEMMSRRSDQQNLEMNAQTGAVIRHSPGAEELRSMDGSNFGLEVTMLSTPPASQTPSLDIHKDIIIEAVKQAYESYKPEIAVHQFGLAREEVMQVLKEGLEEHRSKFSVLDKKIQGPSKTEMVDAVHDAVKVSLEELLPKDRSLFSDSGVSSNGRSVPATDLAEDAIVSSVKQALNDNGWNGGELTIDQDDIEIAVRAGLEAGGLTKSINESRADILAAVKAGYSGITGNVRRVVDQIVRIEWADEERVARDVLLDAVSERLDGMENLMRAILVGVEDSDDESDGSDGIIGILRSEVTRVRSAIGDLSTDINARDSSEAESRTTQTTTLTDALDSHFEKIATKMVDTHTEGGSNIKAVQDTVEEVKGTVTGVQEGINAVKAEVERAGEKMAKEVSGLVPDMISEVDKSIAAAVSRVQEIVDGRDERSDGVKDALSGVREMIESVKETVEDLRQKDLARATSDDDRLKQKEERTKAKEETAKEREERKLVEKEKDREDRLDRTVVTALIVAALEETVPRLTEAGNETVRTGLQDFRGDLDTVRKEITDLAEVTKPVDTEELFGKVKGSIEELRLGLEALIEKTDTDRGGAVKEDISTGFTTGFDGLRSEVTKLFEASDLKEEEVRTKSAAEMNEKDERREQMLVELLELARKAAEKDEPSQEVALADGDRDLDLEVEEVKPDPMAEMKEELKSEMKTVEDLISLLNSKVESIDETVKAEASQVTAVSQSSASKDDIAHLENLFANLKESVVGVQSSVSNLKDVVEAADAKSRLEPETPFATKDDAEAIENVVRNTKARLEEMGEIASKEQVTLVTEGLEGVSSKITSLSENGATKEDVAVVQLLVEDLKMAVEKEFERSKAVREEQETKGVDGAEATEADEGDAPVLKKDLDVLGVVCVDIKNRISDLATAKPDLEGLASRQEIEQVVGLITDFRESHDKMQAAYEGDIMVTAKAFDDRATEAVAILAAVGGVEVTVLGVKDTMEDMKLQLDNLHEKIVEVVEKESGKSKSEEEEEGPSEIARSTEELKSKMGDIHASTDGIKASVRELKTECSGITEAIAKVEMTSGEEHVATREEIARAVELIASLQGSVGSNHPELVGLLSELRESNVRHGSTVDDVHTAVQNVSKQLSEQADSRALTVAEVSDPTENEKEMVEKLGSMDVKMAELLAIRSADSEQVARLDAIHAQMEAAANRLSGLVESQAGQVTAQKVKADEEVLSLRAEADSLRADLAILKAEKESAVSEKDNLLSEKDSLLSLVAALQTERDELASRKGKVAAEVASLETALRIRREEMTEMEGKADRLERRILDGIMDQSRALLLARSKLSSVVGSPMSPSILTSRASMISRPPVSIVQGGMRTQVRNLQAGAGAGAGAGPSSGPGRRIFSLNQINNPAQSNVSGSGLGLHTAVAQGLAGSGIKRSLSLKGKGRKASWNAGKENADGGAGKNTGSGTRKVSTAATDDSFESDYSADTVSKTNHHKNHTRPGADASTDTDDNDDDSFDSSLISGSDVTYESTYLTHDDPDPVVGATTGAQNRRRSSGFAATGAMKEIEEESDESESASESESSDSGSDVGATSRLNRHSVLSVGSDADVVKKAQEVGL